jgi:hypothetical protein
MSKSYGTANFESIESAVKYYSAYGESRSDVEQKIEDEAITIGAPEIPQGCTLHINDEGRYVVTELGVKFSARDRMAGLCTHHEYYSQFVTSRVKQLVNTRFGKRLKQSTDKYFNDIPLKEWDQLTDAIDNSISLLARSAGTTYKPNRGKPGAYISASEKVCLLKAAAQIIRDEKE